MHSAIVNKQKKKKKNPQKSSKCNSEPSSVGFPSPNPGGVPFPWGEPALVLCSIGVALWTLASSIPLPRLAGVPALLVAHQWPVVAQDIHRVLPVPAGAAEVLEAVLRESTTYGNKPTRNSYTLIQVKINHKVLNLLDQCGGGGGFSILDQPGLCRRKAQFDDCTVGTLSPPNMGQSEPE